MTLFRSTLFVPGNNMRMLLKAASARCDVIVIDLEDAVAMDDKRTARVMARDAIKALGAGGARVFARINALDTGLARDDLAAVVRPGLAGVMQPKCETSDSVAELASMLEGLETAAGVESGAIGIMPLVETAKGVMNTREIAAASGRVAACAFGCGDYSRDLGLDVSALTDDMSPLLFARSQIVNACVAARVEPIDGPFFGVLSDMEKFRAETTFAAKLGFRGKLLLHPRQIDAANEIFAPSEKEIAYAGEVAAAFEEAVARGLGATSLGGKMIDRMSYVHAKSVIARAKTIARRRPADGAEPVASLADFFAPKKG